MSLITCASNQSVWRGIDYFEKKKVLNYDRFSEEEYMGIVRGSNGEIYTTLINLPHPRKSKCNCPHADGKRIVCKHMMALYFTIFPDEVEKIYKGAEEAEEEAARYEEELAERVRRYVMRMKKDELQQTVLDLLDYGPDWLYSHFVRMNGLD